MDQINSNVSKITQQDRTKDRSINKQHKSLNQDFSQQKSREDYRDPILVSLYELGENQYWSSEKIQDNRKGKYLELNHADLSAE